MYFRSRSNDELTATEKAYDFHGPTGMMLADIVKQCKLRVMVHVMCAIFLASKSYDPLKLMFQFFVGLMLPLKLRL